MATFVDLVDDRNTEENIPLAKAINLLRFHHQIYGPGRCYIEEDGVEIDPTEV